MVTVIPLCYYASALFFTDFIQLSDSHIEPKNFHPIGTGLIKSMTKRGDGIDDFKLKLKQLLKQLSKAPVADVLGVVNSRGVSGNQSQGEKHWTLFFSLDVWRIGANEIQT